MTIQEFLTNFKESELWGRGDIRLDETDMKEYLAFLDEFCTAGIEDRDITLDDLKKDQGYLYNKMVDYNKAEIIRKTGLNMVWWEYSLEDFFRDSFCDLFPVKDINNVLYGEGWDDEDED